MPRMIAAAGGWRAGGSRPLRRQRVIVRQWRRRQRRALLLAEPARRQSTQSRAPRCLGAAVSSTAKLLAPSPSRGGQRSDVSAVLAPARPACPAPEGTVLWRARAPLRAPRAAPRACAAGSARNKQKLPHAARLFAPLLYMCAIVRESDSSIVAGRSGRAALKWRVAPRPAGQQASAAGTASDRH